MKRRSFVQLISGAVLAAIIKPIDGLGFGQSELEVFRRSPFYIALYSKKPNGAFEELSGSGYRRMPCHDRAIDGKLRILFPEATAYWGVVSAVLTPNGIVRIRQPKRIERGDLLQIELEED